MDYPADDDAERRARREERRAQRSEDRPETSRRKSAPIVDSHFDDRIGETSRRSREREYLPADGPVYKDSKRRKAGWPHSGTDSWVKDHSDAPPPPEDESPVEGAPAPDPDADEAARRALRKSRRASKYDEPADDQEDRDRERRRRRESRRVLSSEGSQGDRRQSRRDSGVVDQTLPRTGSAQRGSWWKKITGV